MTGDLGLTGTRVPTGWFTDIESSNMPTVGGTSLATTFVDVAGDTMTGALIFASPITLTVDSTTPDVSGGNVFVTANTVATSITTFTNGTDGQVIFIVFGDANTTVDELTNIKLSAAFTSTADDTMTLVFVGGDWYEVSRSVN